VSTGYEAPHYVVSFPDTSSFLYPSIFLDTLVSITQSLCFSLNVRYQVSHPYKTRGKIIIVYIFIFMFVEGDRPQLWKELKLVQQILLYHQKARSFFSLWYCQIVASPIC